MGPEKPTTPYAIRVLVRTIVGVLGFAAFCGLVYLGGWWFFAFIAVLAVIALGEYYSALQARGMRPNVALGWLCAVAILYATQHTIEVYNLAGLSGVDRLTGANVEAEADVLQLIMFVLMCSVAGTLIAQFRIKPGQSAVVNSATTVFGVVYVGLLLSFMLRMRYVDVPALAGFEDAGAMARRVGGILFTVLPVWMGDTTAFFVGTLMGRTKLAPLISPNKTVEGSVGHLIATLTGTLLLGSWLHLPLWHCLGLGVLMSIVGQLGDLGKSVLKRDINIKDFGSLLGPHGGVLDRFDAVLFSSPLVYWYCWFVLMR